MEYKEVNLSFGDTIFVHPVFADKLQAKFDGFITLMELEGYDINNSTWDYHYNDDFIEYDFIAQKRFRLLFHLDVSRRLKSIDYYYHNRQHDDVTFKLIIQNLRYPKDDNFHHEIENLFKAILSMS